MNCYTSGVTVAFAAGHSITIDLYKTKLPNNLATTSNSTKIASSGPITSIPSGPIRLLNFSSTFDPVSSSPDYLQVQAVVTGGSVSFNNSSLTVTLSTY
jgi:hypothetical protein